MADPQLIHLLDRAVQHAPPMHLDGEHLLAAGKGRVRRRRVLGAGDTLNQSLERAGRVADFLELGELMCVDALHRRESCGGHFRAESQTEDGEALRHDDEFAYVAAWEFGGEDGLPVLHKEDLIYTAIEMKQRSYK